MNSKHLVSGDPCPPLVPGKLRIYSMRFCPYAQRALLVAAAKKIPYDVVNINLRTKPEFIFEKNPGGKVPTLELAGGKETLYESLIVSDYMDEAYPVSTGHGGGDGSKINRLNSSDPVKRAKDRILIGEFGSVTSLEDRASMLPPETPDGDVKSLLQQLVESLKPFEVELGNRRSKFFGGNDKPGMVDYMIWPWFERFPIQDLFWGDCFNFEEAKSPLKLLNAWEKDMIKDPAVQESYLRPELHHTYRTGKKRGDQDFDLLLHGDV